MATVSIAGCAGSVTAGRTWLRIAVASSSAARASSSARRIWATGVAFAMNPAARSPRAGAVYDTQVTIVGHTDSSGSDGYNQTLSERRADAVRGELARLGVPSSRMSAIGRGEMEPRADNASESGRAQNRRVEILVQSTA
jgi:OmpA family